VQSLKQVLNIYLHKAGLAKGVAQNTAISVWPDVVGEKNIIQHNTRKRGTRNANYKNNNTGLAARAPVSKTRYNNKIKQAYW